MTNSTRAVRQLPKRLCQYTATDGCSIYINCIALNSSSPNRIWFIHLHLFPDISGDVFPRASEQLRVVPNLRIPFSYAPKRNPYALVQSEVA